MYSRGFKLFTSGILAFRVNNLRFPLDVISILKIFQLEKKCKFQTQLCQAENFAFGDI